MRLDSGSRQCSPGMTGMSSASFQRKLESRGQWAEHFVSEQRSEAISFLFRVNDILLFSSSFSLR